MNIRLCKHSTFSSRFIPLRLTRGEPYASQKKQNACKTIIGRCGENIARAFLKKKGYNIIEQNYRTKYTEIDLIAKKNNILIFIEVRTKTNELYGTPEDTINYKKLKKLYSNANSYVGFKKWEGEFRIDAVCIVMNEGGDIKKIEHYEGV